MTSRQIVAIMTWKRYPSESRCQAKHPFSTRSTPSVNNVSKTTVKRVVSKIMIGIIEFEYSSKFNEYYNK